GRVPAELTTAEFFADAARVLRADGVLLANLADGPPLQFARRVVAALESALPNVLIRADAAVLRGRRFGNLVLAASRTELPVGELYRIAAGATFPQRVVSGAALRGFVAGAVPLTDASAMRSPPPPDEIWRVGG
ncbi:MAG: hypothetical protein M3070_00725, partial [Actinomycetota bacterium]|nr:hypothetical protein [Actinomycetota bacterium]